MNPHDKQPVSLAVAVLVVEFLDGKRLHFKVNECSDQVGFFHWGGGEIIQQAKRYGGVYTRHGEALTLNGEPSMTQLYPPEFYPLASIRKMKMLKMSADELSALLAQHAVAEPQRQCWYSDNVVCPYSNQRDDKPVVLAPAHAAEQPKLTWQVLRDACESREAQNLLTADDEAYYGTILTALLASPVAPPPPQKEKK